MLHVSDVLVDLPNAYSRLDFVRHAAQTLPPAWWLISIGVRSRCLGLVFIPMSHPWQEGNTEVGDEYRALKGYSAKRDFAMRLALDPAGSTFQVGRVCCDSISSSLPLRN